MRQYNDSDLFKVSNRNTRTMCKISSKLTIKTPHNDFTDAVLMYKEVAIENLDDQETLYIKSHFI